MTSWPVNARSELVLPRNFPDGGVLESTRRFQVASPASINPARRPIRGSGLGAPDVEWPVPLLALTCWVGAGAPAPVEVEWAHAAADSSVIARACFREAMTDSSTGAR